MQEAGAELSEGKESGFTRFVEEVDILRTRFNLLQPPVEFRRLHRALARLVRQFTVVANLAKLFLKTGSPEYLELLDQKLDPLSELGDKFHKEIQRHNARHSA